MGMPASVRIWPGNGRRLLVAIAIALVCSAALAVGTARAFSARRIHARAAAPSALPHATAVGIQTLELPLPGTKVLRPVRVYRPNVPDSAQIPVVYFLHGDPGHSTDWEIAHLGTAMTDAFRAGAPPFVAVMPDGNGASHSDTEWANAVNGTDQVETFVTQTVIKAVEGPNLRDSAHRAIVGFSMGGYGAMNLALRHPSLYGQIVAISGYYHVDDPSHMFGNKPSAITANSPDHHAIDARGKHVLLMDGTDDGLPLVEGETLRMAGILRSIGVHPTVHFAPGEHTWQYVGSQMPYVISFLERGWGG
jgi:S-formylglutathione hydrolase FrmB